MKGGASMEKESWRAAIVKHFRAGHYRKALLVMSANVGDNGDVLSMIDNFTENADPADDWKEVR